MARYQQLVERVASGAVPAARVQDQTQQYLQTHAPEFLATVMDLGLTFVGNLQRSSSTLTAGLYDRVLGPDVQGPSAPEPPIILELRGPAGSVVASTMVVENTRAETATITCRVSEFTARAFGRRFQPALELEPAQFTLASGAQQDVAIRLTLDPALFAPGADYVATLQISGAGERDLVVQLIARAEPPARDQPAATVSPDTPAKTSKARATSKRKAKSHTQRTDR
jgi:hypothetical protein